MSRNTIILGPIPDLFTRYLLCREGEKFYVIADYRCDTYEKIVEIYYLQENQIEGGGFIVYDDLRDQPYPIKFYGSSRRYLAANHTKAIEVAKEDVQKFAREHWGDKYASAPFEAEFEGC